MVSTEKTYDQLGRLLSESLPHNAGRGAPGSIAYSYDDLDRQTRVVIPNGTGGLVVDSDPANPEIATYTSRAGLTLRGYAIREVKPNGQQIYQYKTVDGKVIQLEYETSFATLASPNSPTNGWTRVRYHYDASGKIVAVTRGTGVTRGGITDDPGQSITIEYDASGRRTAVTEPDKGRSTFTYNARGLVECTTTPGETTCQTYDDAGRPVRLTKDSTDGEMLATYTYDTGTNGVGKLASVTDESGTREFDYDALTGNVTNIKRTYTHQGRTKHFDIVHTYTAGGLLERKEYPALSLTLNYDYYPGGFLKRITLWDPDRRILDSGSTLVLASYGVPDAMGTVPSVTYANGVTVDYTYEATTGKMRTLKASSVAGGTIADYAYAVDDEGLLRAVTDNLVRDGIDLSESFQYDKTHRLTQATGPYGDRTTPEKTLRYTYGADGQPLTFGDRILAYGANEHRLEDSGVIRYTGFDAEGNVTERRRSNGSTKTLTYSYHNRIKSVTMSGNESGQVNFTYDSEGERFLKRYQTSGVDLYTYNMSSEYQMRRVSGEEIHTLLVNKADGALASLSFNSLYLISNAAAPPSLYTKRIATDFSEIKNLGSRNFGTKGPQIIRSMRSNTALLLASLIASWGEHGGPPFFFESEKAIIRAIQNAVLALFAIVSLITLIAFVHWWRRDRINLIWNLPRAFGRITALALVVTFFSGVTNCVAVTGSGEDNEISDGILAAAAASGAFANPENPDIPALIAEMDGLIGNHFYITNQINSNHLVTDVNGKVVCKYVYEPYGKLNMNLTDTDPDKDGSHFLALKKFTGQEFDYETGLYNYNARLYDQETGRFLQPDPVHAEHVGYDNYDRYQYVHSNPVNFTDPSGETASGAGLVPHPAFQTLMALTLLTGVYNWLRYGAFEALTVNRYTGAGANRSPPPTKGTLQTGLIAFAILDMHQAAAPDIAAAGKNWLVFEYYRTSYADSPDGLTETDKVSRIHDRDGPAFHKHKSLRANNRWVSGVWGKWASGEMLRNTAQREYDSTPGYWGPSRPLVAAVNTMATLVSELVVTVLGTILFKVTNFLNEIWYAWKNNPRLNVNSGRYHVNKARLRARIGGWM